LLPSYDNFAETVTRTRTHNRKDTRMNQDFITCPEPLPQTTGQKKSGRKTHNKED